MTCKWKMAEEGGRPTFLVQNEHKIKEYMREVLQNYDGIRGKSKKTLGDKFWDAVVITASDPSQKKAYEDQIEEKIRKKEIPSDVPYLIYSDPPGTRAGCGTCTMFVVEQLRNQFGSEMDNWKILLLHAGGYSQRLPSASVLGKVFTPLPIGNPMYQMIDMKFANYLPFLPRMGPGYLHVGSDTIEVFDLGGEECEWSWKEVGFTVSAQPATLKIGSGHGVYVIAEEEKRKKCSVPGDGANSVPFVEMLDTVEVLQKPTKEVMLEKGAVFDHEFNAWVYTDSIFFFDHSTADKLKVFYEQHKPLECEIDAYGDFLQALGTRATTEYTKNTRNVSKVEPKLIETRLKIFEMLKGTPISTVALNCSKFYHFGTMQEYIYHLCEDDSLAKELNFDRKASSKFFEASKRSPKQPKMCSKIDGCVMHSYLPVSSVIADRAIVEYCWFTVPVSIGGNSIVSNCCCEEDDLNDINIPENCFMHTVPINEDGTVKYVTVFFDVSDDVKKKVSFADSGSLKFFGSSLSDKCKIFGLKLSDLFQDNGSKCSLWSAKLFRARKTMSESFAESLQQLHSILKKDIQEIARLENDVSADRKLYSMSDVKDKKDVKSMLKYRHDLFDIVQS